MKQFNSQKQASPTVWGSSHSSVSTFLTFVVMNSKNFNIFSTIRQLHNLLSCWKLLRRQCFTPSKLPVICVDLKLHWFVTCLLLSATTVILIIFWYYPSICWSLIKKLTIIHIFVWICELLRWNKHHFFAVQVPEMFYVATSLKNMRLFLEPFSFNNIIQNKNLFQFSDKICWHILMCKIWYAEWLQTSQQILYSIFSVCSTLWQLWDTGRSTKIHEF
jgi:hypothetical protein